MQSSQTLASNWVWVMDVIFGGILALAFEKLEQELHTSRAISVRTVVRHICWASALMGFVIYDVGVYHIVLHIFPYTVSAWSAVRFACDFLMAFGLVSILMSGVKAQAENHSFPILLGFTFWHCAAVFWHVAANFEYKHALPPIGVVLPHFLFVAAYWTVGICVWRYNRTAGFMQAVRSVPFMWGLALVVLAVSVLRSIQIIRKYGAAI